LTAGKGFHDFQNLGSLQMPYFLGYIFQGGSKQGKRKDEKSVSVPLQDLV